MKNVLIDQLIFPNLSSLEFTNIAFDFKNNNGLLSFFNKEKFKYHPSLMPNLSFYKMKKQGTHIKDVEEFFNKHRDLPCNIEIELWDP